MPCYVGEGADSFSFVSAFARCLTDLLQVARQVKGAACERKKKAYQPLSLFSFFSFLFGPPIIISLLLPDCHTTTTSTVVSSSTTIPYQDCAIRLPPPSIVPPSLHLFHTSSSLLPTPHHPSIIHRCLHLHLHQARTFAHSMSCRRRRDANGMKTTSTWCSLFLDEQPSV